jgi:hypothetical protein
MGMAEPFFSSFYQESAFAIEYLARCVCYLANWRRSVRHEEFSILVETLAITLTAIDARRIDSQGLRTNPRRVYKISPFTPCRNIGVIGPTYVSICHAQQNWPTCAPE